MEQHKWPWKTVTTNPVFIPGAFLYVTYSGDAAIVLLFALIPADRTRLSSFKLKGSMKRAPKWLIFYLKTLEKSNTHTHTQLLWSDLHFLVAAFLRQRRQKRFNSKQK